MARRPQPNFKKKQLLTPSELLFFKDLVAALPEHHIAPQVAMNGLLDPVGNFWGKAAQLRARRRFSQKVVDFVVVDKDTGQVVVIIELDDPTHDSRAAQYKDAARDAMLQGAGYRTLRWDVRDKPSLEEIKERVANAARTPEPAQRGAEVTHLDGIYAGGLLDWLVAYLASRLSTAQVLGIALAVFGAAAVVGYLAVIRPIKAFLEKPLGGSAVTPAAAQADLRLQPYGFRLRQTAACEAWASAPITRKQPTLDSVIALGADVGCIYPAGPAFAEYRLRDLAVAVSVWNYQLQPAPQCAPYAGWAMEIVQDPQQGTPAKTASLQRLYADAHAKGCMAPTPQ